MIYYPTYEPVLNTIIILCPRVAVSVYLFPSTQSILVK